MFDPNSMFLNCKDIYLDSYIRKFEIEYLSIFGEIITILIKSIL